MGGVLKFVCVCVICFSSGWVVCQNLIFLIGMNMDYDAAWWKIAIAVSIAFFFAYDYKKGKP